jgi:predicted acetyltransferase
MAAPGPVDGALRARIPSLRRWLWFGGDAGDEAEDEARFAGVISLRWTPDGSPLPPHVLGHIGYAVVPWHRRKGCATRALALLLPLARAQGLRQVEITTDPDNLASQRVIERNGGVLVEAFDMGEPYAHASGLRYRIAL